MIGATMYIEALNTKAIQKDFIENQIKTRKNVIWIPTKYTNTPSNVFKNTQRCYVHNVIHEYKQCLSHSVVEFYQNKDGHIY